MSVERSVSVMEGEEVLANRVWLTQEETEELPCGPSWEYPGKGGADDLEQVLASFQ